VQLSLCDGEWLCPYCSTSISVQWQKSSARFMSGEEVQEAICRVPGTILAMISTRPSSIWGQDFECLCGAAFSVESFSEDAANQSYTVVLRRWRCPINRNAEIGWLVDEKSDPVL
jgi:hypothetical protein